MTAYNSKDLATGILDQPVSTTDTIWYLKTGYGAIMPSVPFKLTATPFGMLSTASNSEIVAVTAVSGDTLTVTRAQNGTTAKSFEAGDIVGNGIYSGMIPTFDSDGNLSLGGTLDVSGKTQTTDLTATGDVDFSGANVTMPSNSWANLSMVSAVAGYGGSYGTAQYMKDNSGFVHLRGLIRNVSGGTLGSFRIGTLPVGYRSGITEIFIVNKNYADARVDVDSGGDVSFNNGGGDWANGQWLSFAGMSFKAEN